MMHTTVRKEISDMLAEAGSNLEMLKDISAAVGLLNNTRFTEVTAFNTAGFSEWPSVTVKPDDSTIITFYVTAAAVSSIAGGIRSRFLEGSVRDENAQEKLYALLPSVNFSSDHTLKLFSRYVSDKGLAEKDLRKPVEREFWDRLRIAVGSYRDAVQDSDNLMRDLWNNRYAMEGDFKTVNGLLVVSSRLYDIAKRSSESKNDLRKRMFSAVVYKEKSQQEYFRKLLK